MPLIMMLFRLISLLLLTIFCVLLVIIFYYIIPKNIWIYFVKTWASATVRIMGIRIASNSKNSYLEKNSMIIANHISWLDIPILYTQYSLSFIARAEIKKWPLLNLLIKSAGTIFINRERKRDILNINNIVSNELLNGAVIGLFPEGKTGNGLKLQKFNSALFESAIAANSTIIPVVIQYYTLEGKITTKTTYEGNTTLWQSVKNSLLLNGISVKITKLPRLNSHDFKNREDLSEYLHTKINNCLIGDTP